MTTLAVAVAVIAVFGVAFASPKHGQKIKRWSKRWAGKAFAWFKALPTLVQKIMNTTVRFAHKAIAGSAEKGKKSRRKAPF